MALHQHSMAPPVEYVRDSNSVVIVSMRRPLCVYFDRCMQIVSGRILDFQKSNQEVTITIVGAGAAISRCQQLARYVLREVRTKYKWLVKSAGKRVESGSVAVQDLLLADLTEDSIFDAQEQTRLVGSVKILLSIQL